MFVSRRRGIHRWPCMRICTILGMYPPFTAWAYVYTLSGTGITHLWMLRILWQQLQASQLVAMIINQS